MEGQVTYKGSFGGLWTDRIDATEILADRAAGLSSDDAGRLRDFIEKGFVVIPGAVDLDVIDGLRADIDRAWAEGDDKLFMFPPGSQSPLPLVPGTPTDRARVVDIYVYYESARRALFSPAILNFLELIFERSPLLFQSLSFEKGSQQGMHQDTAYVVCSEPLELAASWIALQDVEEGSGELMYYEGSHRLPEFRFSGQFKHWNPERDGSQQHSDWAELINVNAAEMGLCRRTFLPKKGDALIWAADLAHGGSPVVNTSASRKSLVGHYTPTGVEPNYFGYRPDRRATIAYGRGSYSSEHYDCASAETSAPAPVPTSAPSDTSPRRRLRDLRRNWRT